MIAYLERYFFYFGRINSRNSNYDEIFCPNKPETNSHNHESSLKTGKFWAKAR